MHPALLGRSRSARFNPLCKPLLEGIRVLFKRVKLNVAALCAVLLIAVQLVAQPTIENFIAGLTLYADHPTRVGHFKPFGGTLGKVEEISVRSTHIRTLGDTIISVPNSDFLKARLENLSARGNV